MITSDGQHQDGDIRLVEIFVSETWGTITDTNWTDNDAAVICHKLGHIIPGPVVWES